MPSLYEFPQYYDILFGWDRDSEAQLYADALVEHGVQHGAPILEVAAGTGQIGVRLAHKGWSVTALDSSAAMLTFASRRAEEEGTALESLVANMSAFRIEHTYDAAVNPMSSFRLLPSDADVTSHLDCMADALTVGGVYLIDATFGTDGTAAADLDEWVMHRDGTTVTATTSSVGVVDLVLGLEMTLDWHEALRPYAPEDFIALIHQHPGFTVMGCYRESPTGSDGISRFERTLEPDLPTAGRAVVVLSRT